MDVSLESALKSPGDRPGHIAGRPLEEWNAAYLRVENYFHALRIHNKLLLGQLVLRVLERALRRAAEEPERPTIELAAEEMDSVVTEWFAAVLERIPTGVEHLLNTRGRWPKEFVEAMQETYLRAGPDFQLSKMAPRPLDLGPIATLTNFSRIPYLKMVLSWLIFALLLIAIFHFTHS